MAAEVRRGRPHLALRKSPSSAAFRWPDHSIAAAAPGPPIPSPVYHIPVTTRTCHESVTVTDRASGTKHGEHVSKATPAAVILVCAVTRMQSFAPLLDNSNWQSSISA